MCNPAFCSFASGIVLFRRSNAVTSELSANREEPGSVRYAKAVTTEGVLWMKSPGGESCESATLIRAKRLGSG